MKIKKRYILPSTVLIVGFAISIFVYISLIKLIEKNQQTIFESCARNRYDAIQREIDINLQVLQSIQSLYYVYNDINQSDFANYVRPPLSKNPGIQALEWIPRIRAFERTAYENEKRKNGFPSFHIVDRMAPGKMAGSPSRGEYFPVYFVEPYAGNEDALGYDLASSKIRKESLEKARDTGRMTASGKIKFVQETGDQYGIPVFMPIYEKGKSADTIEERRRNLKGFALGVFRVGDLVERSLNCLAPQGINISVYDESRTENDQLLYFHKSRLLENQNETPNLSEPPIKSVRYLNTAEGEWQMVFTPTPGFMARNKPLYPTLILIFGLILTVGSGGYLYSGISHAEETALRKEQLESEITERTRAQTELSKSKNQYQQLIDQAADGIFVLAPDGRFTLVNSMICKILGYSEKEILQLNFLDIYPLETRDEARQRFSSFQPGEVIRAERQALRKDGTKLTIDMSAVKLEDGTLQGIARDITTRSRMEKELKKISLILDTAIKSSPLAIIVVDNENMVQIWNPAAESIFGWKKAEVIGKELPIIPESKKEEFHGIRDLIFQGCTFTSERSQRLKKGGSILNVSISVAPMNDASGRVIGRMGIFADITEHIRAAEKIRESEESFRSLIESSHDLIQSVAPDGSLIFVNKAWRERLGYGHEEIRDSFQLIHPDNKKDYEILLKEVLKGESLNSFQMRLVAKEGHLIDVEGNVSPRLVDGKITAAQYFFHDITLKKQSEEILKRYQLLTENARDIIIFIRQHGGQIIEANRAAVEAYGYTRDELLSSTILQLRVDMFDLVVAQMDQANSSGILFETVHRRKDGSTFPVEVSSLGATIGGERILLSIIRDITERRTSERERIENETKYRTLFENASDAIFLTRGEVFNDCNIRTLEMFRCSKDQVIGKRISDFSPRFQPDGGDSEELLLEKIRDVFFGIPQLFEWKHSRFDGDLFDAEISLNIIELQGEELILAIVRDISERKQVEEIYKVFSDNSPVGIYIIQDGRFVYANQHMENYSGCGRGELIGSRISDLILPEDLEATKRNSSSMLQRKSYLPYQYRILRKSGAIKWLVETVTPISFRDMPAVLGSAMDITAHKTAEDDLIRAKEMLIQSEKLAAVGLLASGVAHEILNPVNIISLRMQLLEVMEGEVLSEKVKETLSICRSQVERIVKISKDLNKFARISSKERDEVNINDLIAQIISLINPRFMVEQINLTTEYTQNLPVICVDRNRIGQVIMNLANNAVDAMEGKSEKILRISTALEVKDDRSKSIRIIFSDNGAGIKPGYMSKIFDPFFTTKEIGKGTGIGLSISYGIIHDHNGRIWAEENDMGGASFIIDLPVSESETHK